MARGASSSVLRIIIEGDASGAQDAIQGVGVELADAARAWAAFEGFNFLRGVTEQAADLQQAQAMVDQTFGASAGAVRSFAEDAADALGQSEEQAAQAAGSFGYLLQTMGVGQEQAAQMSTRLLELAADLAAFKNTSMEEALTAIQSGIAGEMEPMRRYGAVLSVARIEQEALAMGLDFTSGKMDTQTKAMATYSLMLKDTSIAAGQLNRESDSLEATQNRATANWENAKAELGQNFIPIMTKASEVTSDLASALGNLDRTTQLGLVGLAAWAVVGGRAVTVMGQLGSAAWTAGAAWATNGAFGPRTMSSATAGLSATTKGVLALTAALVSYELASRGLDAIATWKSTGADVDQLATSLERLAISGDVRGELDKFGTDLDGLAAKFGDLNTSIGDVAWDVVFGDVGTSAKAAKDDIDDVDKALARLAAQDPEQARRAFGQLSAALVAQGVSVEEVARRFDDFWEALETAELAAENETMATDENAEAKKAQADAIEEATRAQEEAIAAAERRISAEDALRSAAERRWDAAVELGEAERAAAGDSEEHRRAAEALADAHDGVADARQRVVDAHEAVADAQDGVTAASESLAEAQDGVRKANEEVADRQRDLNEAYGEARERLRDLKIEAREAADAQRQAALDVEAARAERDRILQDSTATDIEKRQAQLDYEQALTRQEAAQREAQQAAQDAAKSVEQDAGVIAAKEALASAADGVRDAYDRVRDAAGGVEEAQERVREAQGRVREALDGVTDAQKRVRDAEKETARVGEEASKRLVAAQKANEDAALDHAEAVGDAEEAMNGAEAGTRAWMDALRELADDLAPNSVLAQRIYRMLSILGTGLSGGPVRSGDYGSADAAEAAREAASGGRSSGRRGPVGAGDYGSADAAEQSRSAPTFVFSPTIHGSSVEVQREMERQGRRWLDEAAMEMSGG